MPAPTVSTVTPSSGVTGGGSLVTITGTDFDFLAVVPVPPVAQPEVTVEFGTGQFATDVRVQSATQLTCIVPAGLIPVEPTTLVPAPPDTLDVDVIVTNVDPGPNQGSGTLTDGYTYSRPDLTVRSHLLEVHRTLLKRMMQQIILNVVSTTQQDYDNQSQDLKNRVERAKLPSVALLGPALSDHRIVNYNDPTFQTLPAGSATPTDYKRYDQLTAVSLDYDVRILSGLKGELMNLIQHAVAFMQRNHHISVLRNPLNAADGVVRYPLTWLAKFVVTDRPTRADVREAVASWRVEGVLLESADIVEAAKTVDSVELTSEQIP
jgi:hypothetical protein